MCSGPEVTLAILPLPGRRSRSSALELKRKIDLLVLRTNAASRSKHKLGGSLAYRQVMTETPRFTKDHGVVPALS
jgi:hypothetical protein